MEIIGFGPIPARIRKFVILILSLSTARKWGSSGGAPAGTEVTVQPRHRAGPAQQTVAGSGSLPLNSMLRNTASGPDIGLPGQILGRAAAGGPIYVFSR